MGNGRWSNETIPIGRDNANNITATTNVVANADGSVLERLEYIQTGAGASGALIPGRTYALAKTATSTADDLFVVTGGPIFILKFQGHVTTAIGSVSNKIYIGLDSEDVSHQNTAFSSSSGLETNADAVGTRYTFNASPTSTMIPVSSANAGTSNIMMPWFCGIGVIEQYKPTGDGTTGAIVWYMLFTPLTTGVSVTVAP